MDWGGGAGQQIAPLVADLGRIQARGVEQKGAIWGHTLSQLGNLIAQAPERQALQQERQARAADLQGLAQDRQAKAAAMQRLEAGQQALAKQLNNPDNIDPETGAIDHQKVATALGQDGFADMGGSYLKQAAANEEAFSKLDERKQHIYSVLGRGAAKVTTPEDFTSMLAVSHQLGVPQAFLDHISQQADQMGPDGWKTVSQQLADMTGNKATEGKTREIRVGNPDGSETIQIVEDKPNQTFTSSPKPKPLTDIKPGSFEAYVVSKYGPTPNGDQMLAARRSWEDAGRKVDAPGAAGNAGDTNDVKETIAGMKDGSLPPIMPGRASREYTALLAEAHRQGYDLAGAATDWAATQKRIATLNGQQQLRLNQAIGQLPELLDSVETLAKQWKGGSFPLLNKANLALAKNGAYGPKAASIATQLDQQIADVTGDLGAVYMGGNSPTDHALQLAQTALNSNWSEPVLLDMVKRARQNVQIRQNSIRNTGVQGASADNPYAPPAPKTPDANVVNWTRDKNGKLVPGK